MERLDCTGCSQNWEEMAARTSCRLVSFSGTIGMAGVLDAAQRSAVLLVLPLVLVLAQFSRHHLIRLMFAQLKGLGML